MQLGIIGSRKFLDYTELQSKLLWLFNVNTITGITSGGAKGADTLAKKFAEDFGISYTEFPAQWDVYGKSAGFRRNHFIVNDSDIIIAFWDGVSKGTKDTLDKARLIKKPTIIFYV